MGGGGTCTLGFSPAQTLLRAGPHSRRPSWTLPQFPILDWSVSSSYAAPEAEGVTGSVVSVGDSGSASVLEEVDTLTVTPRGGSGGRWAALGGVLPPPEPAAGLCFGGAGAVVGREPPTPQAVAPRHSLSWAGPGPVQLQVGWSQSWVTPTRRGGGVCILQILFSFSALSLRPSALADTVKVRFELQAGLCLPLSFRIFANLQFT